ncbi:MAG TPA: hypothetical protein VJX67_01705 [Blastocatellia bacterium]|nr:hypothetical protein [Blastocatellia bacterium]
MGVTDNGLEDKHTVANGPGRLKMMQQIAEGLEDEAHSLTRRARAIEEEEAQISQEVEELQTGIQRLSLRSTSLRGEREALLAKIDKLHHEADSIRDKAISAEEELALQSLELRAAVRTAPDRRETPRLSSASVEAAPASAPRQEPEPQSAPPDSNGNRQESVFFRRISLMNVVS